MDKIAKVKRQVMLKEWAEMVQACRSSGSTVEKWCNENGVNTKTYYYRLKRVREYLCDNPGRDIVPINAAVPSLNESSITVTTDKVKLEIPQSIQAELLLKIIEAVKC